MSGPDDPLSLDARGGLPADIAFLKTRYPADEWSDHANYGALSRFWREVHDSLREEGRHLAATVAAFREQPEPPAVFAPRFTARLEHHLAHLEHHHGIEDALYFPRFRALDRRMAAGFDLLENDHLVIHRELVETAARARTLVEDLVRGHDAPRRTLARYTDQAEWLLLLLERHLADEEDLVIPAMLEHGERRLG